MIGENILVVAPHADDEVFGCAGTLLKAKTEGAKIYWALVTEPDRMPSVTSEYLQKREENIAKICSKMGFESCFRLGFSSCYLDTYPILEIIEKLSIIIKKTTVDTIFIPYRHDAHSDHKIVYDASVACTKSFRFTNVKRVFAYETQSETDFDQHPNIGRFAPNYFVDITRELPDKLDLISVYDTEINEHPFPRSLQSAEAYAIVRGCSANCTYAEAFQIIKMIEK